MSDLKAIFEDIAVFNRWDGEESRSGPGSSLLYTCNLRSQLEVFLEKFQIRSLFDAPCGDFNWMKEVRLPKGTTYLGGDIAPSLITANVSRFAAPGRRFVEFDVVSDPLPEYDMWFCRDCLFHLPDALVGKALRNFAASGIKYLMMTNHINSTRFRNRDVRAGDFRRIDFYAAPWRLPREVAFSIADYVHPFPQREMCVWTHEQIAAACARF